MNAYGFFKYFHSGFRYVVVILVLIAIIQSLLGMAGKKPYTDGNRKLNLFALISAHTQLLIGLVLYFLSPLVQFGSQTMKNQDTRYWTVEHLTMMIIAIVLITVGYSRSKKAILPQSKHQTIFIFYTIAFIIVFVAIMLSKRGLFNLPA